MPAPKKTPQFLQEVIEPDVQPVVEPEPEVLIEEEKPKKASRLKAAVKKVTSRKKK